LGNQFQTVIQSNYHTCTRCSMAY